MVTYGMVTYGDVPTVEHLSDGRVRHEERPRLLQLFSQRMSVYELNLFF
jgi:hypothetical protein